jgi:hypothetical protein
MSARAAEDESVSLGEVTEIQAEDIEWEEALVKRGPRQIGF